MEIVVHSQGVAFMQCVSCTAMLPPGATTCSECGKPLAYHAFLDSQAGSRLTRDLSPLGAASRVPTRGQRGRRIMGQLLLAALAVVIVVGSGLLYYTQVFRPAQLLAQATAAVDATATGWAYATATRQAITPQMIYQQATHGTPALNDSLSSRESSYWRALQRNIGSCAFAGGTYHVLISRKNSFFFCAAWPVFNNFAYQVQMTIVKGDGGGIVFRANPVASTCYLFTVSQDGHYTLNLFVDNNPDHIQPLTGSDSPVIHSGLHQSNLLTVIVRGGSTYLYINTQYIATVSDDTFTTGNVGVASVDYSHPPEVTFSHAQVWSL
ncbi:MAG: zinc ribbon domain-containing protein [Ktedonobacteraceae bacterium]|nr:zinc ribbon domain-containing protein [Ktedonobacteraceae bacterium]